MSVPELYKEDHGYWYAKWSDARRSKRKSMGTQDRATAEQRFAQWLLMRHEAPADERSYTVADIWAVYEAKCPGGRTDTARYSWKNLEIHFADIAPEMIDQDVIDAYVKARTSGRIGRKSQPSTCRREISTLVAALNFCTRKPNALIAAGDLQPITLPPDSDPRDRWLTMAEVQKLFDAAREMRRGDKLSRGERFVWIALETATRKQAILDLTWDRVDFEIGVIHFDVPGRKKTKKRRASVPISSSLRPILERAYAERENDLVMGNKGAVWDTVQRIVIRAGLGGERPKGNAKARSTGISPHTFRHTAATHMARNGVPLWTIAQILGNTLTMVEKVYAKWAPADAERNVDMISRGKVEAAE